MGRSIGVDAKDHWVDGEEHWGRDRWGGALEWMPRNAGMDGEEHSI